MNRRVDIEGRSRAEESEMLLRVLQNKSDWPRSARQLGQRNPNDNKAGDYHWGQGGIYLVGPL
jgi:hypothetical protein